MRRGRADETPGGEGGRGSILKRVSKRKGGEKGAGKQRTSEAIGDEEGDSSTRHSGRSMIPAGGEPGGLHTRVCPLRRMRFGRAAARRSDQSRTHYAPRTDPVSIYD